MKSIWFLTALCFPFLVQTIEYAIQYENSEIRVSRIALLPGEKLGLHRDEYPRVVFGVKGGVITRLEADGSTNDVLFPTGQSVFLEADPIGQLHSGTNGKTDLEIIVVELKTKTSKATP